MWRHVLCWATLALLVMVPGTARAGVLVISQIYGGGGNAGSTFTNDFIEIFNPSLTPVNLLGDSVQYTASTGTTWEVTPFLTSTILQPGQYFLVQEFAGLGGTVSLPSPDATGSINLSATDGKVALVSSTVALIGGAPTGSNILDFVGYGSNADAFEGAGPTPTPSNTSAVLRLNGLMDSDNNNLDFLTGSPNPRNTTAALNPPPTEPPPGPEPSVPEPSAFVLTSLGLLGLLGSAKLPRHSSSCQVRSTGVQHSRRR